jgi:hypothetical protein
MQTLPILALCLLAVAAALPATHGAACETKLPWSSSAQAFASPVRVKFQGYPTITLRPQAKGTVSGNVIISTPTGGYAVCTGCMRAALACCLRTLHIFGACVEPCLGGAGPLIPYVHLQDPC